MLNLPQKQYFLYFFYIFTAIIVIYAYNTVKAVKTKKGSCVILTHKPFSMNFDVQKYFRPSLVSGELRIFRTHRTRAIYYKEF